MQSNSNSNLENRGWEGMKVLLDEQMPTKVMRHWWLYVLLGLVALFIAGYFFTQSKNTQLESQPHPAREMPVAMHEQSSDDDGELDELGGAQGEQSRDGYAALSSHSKDQQERIESGVQKEGKEHEVRGGTTNEFDVNQLKRKTGVVLDELAKEEVVAERTYENSGESEPLSKPPVFHIDVTIREGVVSFPQRQKFGVDVAIGDSINKKGDPFSLDLDLGLEKYLHDDANFDVAKNEEEKESGSEAESPAETNVQAKSRHSFQLETGYIPNTGSGHGPSIGLTFATKLLDRVHFTTSLSYAMHSQEFFLYGIDESDGYYTVFTRDIKNPINEENEIFTNGIVNLGSHDRVNSTVIIRPGLSYDFLKSEKHELNFRIDGWLTYGNLHENIQISYDNGFVVEGEQLVEDPISTIMSVQQSSWGIGYGARLEYLFNVKEQYSIGLSLGHGDSYSNNYSMNFINALIKYNFG